MPLARLRFIGPLSNLSGSALICLISFLSVLSLLDPGIMAVMMKPNKTRQGTEMTSCFAMKISRESENTSCHLRQCRISALGLGNRWDQLYLSSMG